MGKIACNKRDMFIPVNDEMLLIKAKEFGNEYFGLYNVNFKFKQVKFQTVISKQKEKN